MKALKERIEEMEAILKERAKITDEAKEVADEHPRHRIYNKIKARRGKNGNRCNSSSPDGIGLLGADKEGILFKRRSGRIKKL